MQREFGTRRLEFFTVAVVGAGLSGSLFALKLAKARPDWTVLLIEDRARAGRGLAYGGCDPRHLLNVPVHRMDVGLEPPFQDWLRSHVPYMAREEEPLADAFVPRYLFGDYMAQRLAEASGSGLRVIEGRAVQADPHSRRILLSDGSSLPADVVVLATGNLAPRLPFFATPSRRILADPWEEGVLECIGKNDSLLLLGTGLTMVDMLIALDARGHKGPIHAVSRHGCLPKAHRSGGAWPAFLDASFSPRQALGAIRTQARLAEERHIPWQRVFDAVRPMVASLWQAWGVGQRAQFLRHLRTLWDVHRHRMAERIAVQLDALLWSGALTVTAGRVLAVDEHRSGITAVIRPRGEKTLTVDVDRILNCTGPATDLRQTSHVLLKDLLRRGLVRSDPLGLGVDTEDCAARTAEGVVSDWLFALGPLTRPAFWEITAVPEINAQIDGLVRHLSRGLRDPLPPLPAIFLDMGAGI